MKVSVLIPLFNAEKYIEQTLMSICQQTYKDFEVVVVDDCGGDSSVRIVEEYQKKDSRIRIIHNEQNMGIAYSRNRGLAECRGEYVALLDDDDLMMPDRLKVQVEYLDNHPEIGAVGGNAQWIDENNNIVRDTIAVITDPIQIKMFLNFRNIFNNSEMTIRKSIIKEHNIEYSSGCYGMEDYKFWIEFSRVALISNLQELILKKRVFSNNETFRMRREQATARKNRYLELQIYSLQKSGFEITPKIKRLMGKYMGETPAVCTNYNELSELSALLGMLTEQACRANMDIRECMEMWFHALIADQNDNVLRCLDSKVQTNYWKQKCDDMERYMQQLIDGKAWLESHVEKLEDNVKELENGKAWLEKHTQELEMHVEELVKGKEWSEKHAQELEKYVDELIKGKEWLEQHSEAQEQYISELLSKNKG